MSLVDSILLGQLGTSHLAAVGLGATLVFLGYSFGNGLLSGVRILVSRATGAGHPEQAAALVWQGLWIALGLGLVVIALLPVARASLGFMGASDDVRTLALEWLTLRAAGTPLVFATTALAGGFQGRGRTQVTMAATLLANGVNLALDPLLIFGWGPVPALGISGAALASVVGHSAGLLLLVVVARGELRRIVLPRLVLLRQIVAVGGPTGAQYLLDVTAYAVFAGLLAGAGDEHLAAHVVVVRIILVSFLPCHALGEATSVLVGQSLGAGIQRERAGSSGSPRHKA